MTAAPIQIEVLRLESAQGLDLPSYATAGAAGMDLRSSEAVELAPLARALVPTGLKLAIPAGFEGQVRPRSGLAARFGVTVLNAPGTIDADYRGEVKVLLVNLGPEPVRLERGERIAQIVFAAVQTANLVLVTALDETARGAGGFGHTGRS